MILIYLCLNNENVFLNVFSCLIDVKIKYSETIISNDETKNKRVYGSCRV